MHIRSPGKNTPNYTTTHNSITIVLYITIVVVIILILHSFIAMLAQVQVQLKLQYNNKIQKTHKKEKYIIMIRPFFSIALAQF